jgi:hypothetical protein
MKKKQHSILAYTRVLFPGTVFTCLLCFFSTVINAQQKRVAHSNVVPEKDIADLIKQVLHKKTDSSKDTKNKGVAILPSIGYNPSFGFLIGAKLSAVKKIGNNNDSGTDLSAFGLEALITSKGIITLQARHDVFTSGNKWKFQGNWQLSKFLITDYGVGTGTKNYEYKSDSAFPIKFTFIRLTEKIYRKIGGHLYAGVGISFDIRSNIDDEKLTSYPTTPHRNYSLSNGFDTARYSANGLLVALQYNTRDHPIRSYKGSYADVGFRFNQHWMGSSKNAIQFTYDLRKYFSLSHKNPQHVLAFWHWASYKLSGELPYLEMPATAYDTYSRSGRAYTIGRFKGPSYACFESEWRYPISRNKLLSGVVFGSLQTASDDLQKKLFQYWEGAVGGGLRVLFKKQSRSTICIDYAWGQYGSNGFFFGLNEVF